MGRPARDVAGFLAIYAAWVVLVNAAPGPWRKWSRGETVDPWTLTHVAFGALAYEKGLSLGEINALGILNEAGQTSWRTLPPIRPDGFCGVRSQLAGQTRGSANGGMGLPA